MVNIINEIKILELVEVVVRKQNDHNGAHYSRSNNNKWNYSYNMYITKITTITIRINLK